MTIRSKYISLSLHVLIWGTLLLLPWLLPSPDDPQNKIGPLPGAFFSILNLVNMGIFYGNAFYLYPKWYNRRYWWLYLLSIGALVFLSFALKWNVMHSWFPEVLEHIGAMPLVFGTSFLFLILSIVYRRIIDRIRFEKEQREKEAARLATELKFLRSQISPHFLFNVLTNFVSLARKKSDKLEPALHMLSDLMRYMLYDSSGEKVALQKEVGYLQSYIELQKLRFGDEVEISTHIDTGNDEAGIRIEPMLLIPFVENAFKHGVGMIPDPRIIVNLRVDKGILVFEVQNQFDRQQDTSKDESSGIGLNNVRMRLDLLYPGRYELEIRDENNLFHTILTLHLQDV